MDKKINEFARQVRSKGYKLTPQREIILKILIKNRDNPLTPEGVYEQAKVLHPRTGLTTVYRTLELLKEIGLVNHVHFHNGCDRYEINYGRPHHYLICLNCGKTERTNVCLAEKMQKKLKKNTAFRVTEHCLSFFGYCQSCWLRK